MNKLSEIQGLQQLKLGKNVDLTLTVQYDTEPVAIINHAKLLAHHVYVEIKKNTLLFETEGKAWLIDQLDYSTKKTGSYILQFTKQKVWVVYEIIHDKKTELLSMFQQIRRSNIDTRMVQYPLYATMALLILTEGYMIWKLAIQHEMIFITNIILRLL